MKGGLDLSKFKKVRETSTHAVLEHPEGHQIHVAKGALNPKTAAQLAKLSMADGGSVPADGASSSQNQKANLKEKSEKKHPAGKAKKMAGGGFVSPQLPGNVYPSSADQYQASAVQGGNPAGGVGVQPIGAPAMSGAGATAQPAAAVPTNPTIDIASLSRASSAPGMNMPGLQDAMARYMKQYEGAFGQQEAGIRAQAKAEGELGRHEAEAQAADQSMKLLIKQNHEDQYNQLNDEITKSIRDIDAGHIDPDHYLNSKSDFGKVKTAIGLILGGIGSGMTGGPNAALQFLNARIDRDLLAQRLNLGKKETVLGGYLKQMGNLNDATKMTWAFYNDLYTSELKKQAALMRDPIAQAQAKQLIGEREQQKAQVLGPLAFQRALMGTMQSGQIDPAAAVRMYGQMGIITPKQTEDATKEIGKAQQIEQMRANMLDSFHHIHQQILNGAFSPNDTDSAKKAFAGALQHVSEGRYNQEAAENIADSLLPGKTDAESTVSNKLNRLNKFFDAFREEPTLQSIGMKLPRARSSLTMPNSKVMPGYR